MSFQFPSPKDKVEDLQIKLLGLGFREDALRDLACVTIQDEDPEARALAARILALWFTELGDTERCEEALRYLAIAERHGRDPRFNATLATIELQCRARLEDFAGGAECYRRAALAGTIDPDTILARANFHSAAEDKCVWINEALRVFGISPVHLLPADGRSDFDRLAGSGPRDEIRSGPTVSVIIAVYNAAATIETAVRSLLDQTWKSLEIIIVDDCSSDDGATRRLLQRLSEESDLIRVVEMETNGGAYVARNEGLDRASGKYVTLHDADDWSHPSKIEAQVRFMESRPDVVACTSEQARATDELVFSKVRSRLITYNTSSLMFRKAEVQRELGYWDAVRFAADTEFINRIIDVFGRDAFRKVRTGPLSFQRMGPTSVTTGSATGLSGVYYGPRREYHEAAKFYMNRAGSRRYRKHQERPFPAPRMMRPIKENIGSSPGHYPLVVQGDFRVADEAVLEFISTLPQHIARYGRIGLVAEHVYDAPLPSANSICDEVRERLKDGDVEVIVFGETITCEDTICLHDGPREKQAFLPQVRRVSS